MRSPVIHDPYRQLAVAAAEFAQECIDRHCGLMNTFLDRYVIWANQARRGNIEHAVGLVAISTKLAAKMGMTAMFTVPQSFVFGHFALDNG